MWGTGLGELGYRKYRLPFCPSSEASYPKAPHSFVVQVTVFAVGPAQIALIRVGLAAKSLAGASLDVTGDWPPPQPASKANRTASVGIKQVTSSNIGLYVCLIDIWPPWLKVVESTT